MLDIQKSEQRVEQSKESFTGGRDFTPLLLPVDAAGLEDQAYSYDGGTGRVSPGKTLQTWFGCRGVFLGGYGMVSGTSLRSTSTRSFEDAGSEAAMVW